MCLCLCLPVSVCLFVSVCLSVSLALSLSLHPNPCTPASLSLSLDKAAIHIEKVHLYALKRFLGVDMKTPNDLVYGETDFQLRRTPPSDVFAIG